MLVVGQKWPHLYSSARETHKNDNNKPSKYNFKTELVVANRRRLCGFWGLGMWPINTFPCRKNYCLTSHLREFSFVLKTPATNLTQNRPRSRILQNLKLSEGSFTISMSFRRRLMCWEGGWLWIMMMIFFSLRWFFKGMQSVDWLVGCCQVELLNFHTPQPPFLSFVLSSAL